MIWPKETLASCTNISRTGKAPNELGEWINKVTWAPGDVFRPETYSDYLKESSAVVHSLGILFENSNYKTTINGEISKAFNNITAAHSMPQTYDEINHISAVLLAQKFAELKNKKEHSKFVYISADDPGPFIPSGYIKSKRAAEFDLLEKFQDSLDITIARPGFMYDTNDSSSVRLYVHLLLDTLNALPLVSRMVSPSISTQQVALKIIDSLDEDGNRVLLLKNLLR